MKSEICMPAGALAKSGGESEPTTPQVGDQVECTVGGTISRVEGDNVYLTPETVNGEPVMDGGAESGEPDGDENMDQTVADARREDMP